MSLLLRLCPLVSSTNVEEIELLVPTLGSLVTETGNACVSELADRSLVQPTSRPR